MAKTRKKVTVQCAECGELYTTLAQTAKRTLKRLGKYTCPDCANVIGHQKAKQTFLEKYGVDNPGKVSEVQEKMKRTCLEKYGYTTPFASLEVQEKIKKDREEKTGYKNPAQNPLVQAKIRATNLEKYGTESALSAPEVREKIMKSFNKNGTLPVSKPQLQCFDILKNLGYDVTLNYPEGVLSLDVLIKIDEIRIDFEFDGWYWHQDAQKDCARNAILRDLGYKIFRVKSYSDKVPTKEEIQQGIQELLSTDKWIYYMEIL